MDNGAEPEQRLFVEIVHVFRIQWTNRPDLDFGYLTAYRTEGFKMIIVSVCERG